MTERKINDCLVRFLEFNHLLVDIQCGFRPNHITLPQLALQPAQDSPKPLLTVSSFKSCSCTTIGFGFMSVYTDSLKTGWLNIFICNCDWDCWYVARRAHSKPSILKTPTNKNENDKNNTKGKDKFKDKDKNVAISSGRSATTIAASVKSTENTWPIRWYAQMFQRFF